MDIDRYIKDSNNLVHIESQRIMNGLRRHGFEIIDEENTLLFISMTIESIGNKVGISLMVESRTDMSRDALDIIILDSLHVCIRIMHSLNGHPIDKNKLGRNSYTNRLVTIDTYFAKEILTVGESLSNLFD